MEVAQPASPRQGAAFWKRAVPLGDAKKLLGLGFVLAVAVIWVAASFVVQVRPWRRHRAGPCAAAVAVGVCSSTGVQAR